MKVNKFVQFMKLVYCSLSLIQKHLCFKTLCNYLCFSK